MANFKLTTLAANGVVSTVFSADGAYLFASTATGRVVQYDVASGQRLGVWNAHAKIGALSLSDDGHYLLGAGSAADRAVVVRFDTVTGDAKRFAVPQGSFLDVQVVNDHQALLSGHGTNLMTLDFVNGGFTSVPQSTYYSAYADLTRAGRYTLIAEEGISNGPLALYDGRRGEIVARGDDYQSGANDGFNWGIQAVSAKAGLVAQFIYYGSINIYDMTLHAQHVVNVGERLGGMVFDAIGRSLYVYEIDSGLVAKYDTHTWQVLKTYAVPQSDWNNAESYGDGLVLSPDGKHLSILNTNTGQLTLLDLAPRATTFTAVSHHAFGGDAMFGQVHHPLAMEDALPHVALV